MCRRIFHVIRVAGILIGLHASDQKARAELMRELRTEFGLVERNEAPGAG
jgi:hypothetical protein